jgi:uncharacterized protein (TIGR03089 family)
VDLTSRGDGTRTLVGADRVLVTFCDDATGERTELDAAALGGLVARTASLLRDGCGLRAGDRVAVLLPTHWQTAAVLLGAWSIGLAVSYRPWATAGLGPTPTYDAVDAVFVARNRVESWLETVPSARHRFVLGLVADTPLDTPEGYRDYLTEIGRYPDPAPEYWSVAPSDPASPDGTTFQELAAVAQGIAAKYGLAAGHRVLVDAAADNHPLTWLLAPLMAGASIVVCANLDPAKVPDRMTAERITHVL